METSIQVDKETLKRLKKIKGNMKLRSYNEVISKVLQEKSKKSMYGFLAKRKYTVEEILKELRDERDRKVLS